MNYTQQDQQYRVSVLTCLRATHRQADAQKAVNFPEDGIVKMYYDRKIDGYVAMRPSNFVYQKLRQLVAQYRREYAEKWG